MFDLKIPTIQLGLANRIGEIFKRSACAHPPVFGLVPFTAISFLIGSLVSRFDCIAVGKVSGSDPESVFVAER